MPTERKRGGDGRDIQWHIGRWPSSSARRPWRSEKACDAWVSCVRSGSAEPWALMSEEVSTVFVAGFPPDATQRELENLCRFLPGFVKAKASFTRGITLWALFDSVPEAEAAIRLLKDQAGKRLKMKG